MREGQTEGASRVLARSRHLAAQRGSNSIDPIDLFDALLSETECRASVLLSEAGFLVEESADLHKFDGSEFDGYEIESSEGATEGHPQLSKALHSILAEATQFVRSINRSLSVGTEHLLIGLLRVPSPASEKLSEAGIHDQTITSLILDDLPVASDPIVPTEDTPPPVLADFGEQGQVARILDAAANRAREGLRVVEDYVRFVLDDQAITRKLKAIRHRFAEAIRGIDPGLLMTARDTPGDVGTHIVAFDEQVRGDLSSVIVANCKRVAESLRSLEEYSKINDRWLAGRFESLRYDLYVIEKQLSASLRSHQDFQDRYLYFLVGGLPTLGDLIWIVEEAIAGGADIIQYREKSLSDRQFLHHARELRLITAASNVLFIINDRPDLARLASADGVHLGQEDLRVRDARRILGPNRLIGVSTHDPAQLDTAITDGANYLGVGPIFTSGTKEFDSLAGTNYVEHAADNAGLPWFAIGGINRENIGQALAAGATRIAVSGAIQHAERPRIAAQELKDHLIEVNLPSNRLG